jgi:hypothetical protein
MQLAKIAVSTLAGFLLASLLAAQTPEGPEIRASTQAGFALNSAVATAANGDFIVAWQGLSLTAHDRIWARRFSASGKPRGHEFPVDPSTRKDQQVPVVAMAPGGGFIVAWETRDRLFHTDVFVRCFSADGRALGPALRAAGSQPAVAAAPDGSFLMLWSSADGILARRFAADGRPIGPAFKPLSETPPSSPRVLADGKGGFLAGWRTYSPLPSISPGTIMAQRLDAEGQPLGAPSEAISTPYTPNYFSGIAMAVTDTGEFLFVWGGAEPGVPPDSQGFPRLGILGQKFSADGTLLGKTFLIHDGVPALDDTPAIVALPGGGYFLVWSTDGFGYGILGKSIASDGSLGPELQISGSHQGYGPAMALFRNGGGVVTWSTILERTTAIVLRRLAPPR